MAYLILITLLFQASSVFAAAKDVKQPQQPAIPAEFQNALADHNQAVEAIGDAMIKSGLLSPWLKDMRDTQKALNNLEQKNKFGIKEYAMQQMIKTTDRCKEVEKKGNTPDPLQGKINDLEEQRRILIEKIVQNKSADVSGLIKLNKQVNDTMDAVLEPIRNKKGQPLPAQAPKPKGSAEYDALINKLKALDDVLTQASYGESLGMLKQPIKDLLGSKQVKPYVDILAKMEDGQGCPPSVGTYRRYADDLYADFINMLYIFYSSEAAREQRKEKAPKTA